jgi:hypothetical protein
MWAASRGCDGGTPPFCSNALVRFAAIEFGRSRGMPFKTRNRRIRHREVDYHVSVAFADNGQRHAQFADARHNTCVLA